jgi:hypothetical protein
MWCLVDFPLLTFVLLLQHLDATLSALHGEHAMRRQEIRSKLRGLSQSVEEALMHIRHHSEWKHPL